MKLTFGVKNRNIGQYLHKYPHQMLPQPSFYPLVIVSTSDLPWEHSFQLFNLEPLSSLSEIENPALHIDVKCLKCDYRFKVAPKVVSNTFLDPAKYSHCPNCRNQVNVILDHIDLKRQILKDKGLKINEQDIQNVISKKSSIRLTDDNNKEYTATAYDVAYKPVSKLVSDKKTPKSKTHSISETSSEFDVSAFIKIQQHPSIEYRKQYYYDVVSKLNNYKVRSIRGWEDVVAFQHGKQIVLFTLGYFSDMDYRYLTDDAVQVFGKDTSIEIFEEQKMLKVLQET